MLNDSEISNKLDRVVQLLEGDGKDAPGVLSRLSVIERVLFGKEGTGGLLVEHRVMWRAHVWALCTLSAGAGSAVTLIIKHFV